MKMLDEASASRPTYPYWHQAGFENLMPPILKKY
jgi:hypothetical protein